MPSDIEAKCRAAAERRSVKTAGLSLYIDDSTDARNWFEQTIHRMAHALAVEHILRKTFAPAAEQPAAPAPTGSGGEGESDV